MIDACFFLSVRSQLASVHEGPLRVSWIVGVERWLRRLNKSYTSVDFVNYLIGIANGGLSSCIIFVGYFIGLADWIVGRHIVRASSLASIFDHEEFDGALFARPINSK